MSPARRIAVGDIHGCVHALECLLDAIDPQSKDEIVVLGDFVDQGNETSLVVDRLIELGRQCQLVCLLGNHEEMLLAAGKSDEACRYWELCGGVSTLNSYFFGATLATIPQDHIRFVKACRDYHETDRHIFVHANYDAERPISKWEPHTLRWELLDPALSQPHQSGKTVVVGHTEQHDGEVLNLGFVCCIDTSCWRYGWLTALDVDTGQQWQASRFGQLRMPDEEAIGPTGQRRG